ncbi:MAG TPA: DUF885 family protein, partial [Steroidobacteraceae bacterium]|nr:DUF885 family protein [Steroidobacteraceae bacterium]
MKRFSLLLLCTLLGAITSAQAADQAPSAPAAPQPWIAESNRHAAVLLDIIAKYGPESASFLGVEGHDDEIFDLKPQFAERQEADLVKAAAQLEAARTAATDPLVKQDLDILIQAANRQRITTELNRKLMLPYFDLPQAIFNGFQNLLDARVPQERQANAVTRLKRYAGAEKGYEPITMLARARYEESA